MSSYNNGSIQNIQAYKDIPLPIAIKSNLTAFGDLRVANATPEVQLSFIYGAINPLQVITEVSGGTLTASDSLASISSGTGASDYGALVSRRYIAYRTGQGSTFIGTAIFDTPVVGNTQLFGCGTEDNGFFFGYHDLSFGILRRDNGTDNWTYQQDWNTDKSAELNPQLGNVYKIEYQWLGFGCIDYSIEKNTSEITVRHRIQYPNTSTTPTIRQPSFPIRIESRNTGNTSNVVIKTASLAGFNEGSIADLGSIFSRESTKASITAESNVLTIKVNDTINSVEAYVPVVPYQLSIAAVGTTGKPVIYGLYIDKPLTSPSYTNIDASYSVCSYDTSGTLAAGGTKVGTYLIERNKSLIINVKELPISLTRGQTLTITASSTTSFDADTALVWLERNQG